MQTEEKDFSSMKRNGRRLKKVGIGVIGYGFMGKVHSNAYIKIPFSFENLAYSPELKALCGRREETLAEVSKQFGYPDYYTDWKRALENREIDVIDNCAPDDMHKDISIAAIAAGKHILCEKPLAMTVRDSKEMYEAARNSDAKHMLCHNYRFIPAVRLAKELIDDGALGSIYQFRGKYLQEAGHNPQEPRENVWYASGTKSGVLLGIGCHIIDMARFLVGEIASVSGLVRTYNTRRPNKSGEMESVTADEENIALVDFENNAIGTIESSCISTGRKNQMAWEINGSEGSISFDLEDPNHLQVCIEGSYKKLAEGFTNVSVTDPIHPLRISYLPPGHNYGWEYGHVHALNHFLECIVNDKPVEPYGASFFDGYRLQVIMDAIVRSSATGKKIDV